MLKFFRSPLGIAVTVVAAVFAMSPEARKFARNLAVKGTAAVLGVVDQVKDVTIGVDKQRKGAFEEAQIDSNSYFFEPEPELEDKIPKDFLQNNVNVLNDQLIKEAIQKAENP